jgi:transposase
VDRAPAPRARTSAVAVFDAQIIRWLDQRLPVTRMLELARADPDHPYTGGPTAFFTYIRKRRRTLGQTPTVAIRFEGLPGEFLQIDWGEVRQFPFTHPTLTDQTRYFFAARLKYSRFMFVRFTADMREETLLRCLIACFVALGGVPWVVTTDNMKTVTLGRNDHHQPIWQPAYQKLAAEFGFHPEACTPGAPNQKGSVENLVKFVQTNFLAGRRFHDDADLAQECGQWLTRVNTTRPSQATEQVPTVLLAVEHPKFSPLPATAQDYGFFDSVVVSRESLVLIETNRYSVPVQYVGQTLTARLHPERIELFAGAQRVASHVRARGRGQRVVEPAHFAAAFAQKPRARVMVYRDWLVGLAPIAAEYLSVICRKRRATMEAEIIALYELAQQLPLADFIGVLELAAEQQLYGVEYLRAILAPAVGPAPSRPAESVDLTRQAQQTVERDLAEYECDVANRGQLLNLVSAPVGGAG